MNLRPLSAMLAGAGLSLSLSLGAGIGVATPAHASSCGDEIAKLENRLKSSKADPALGPSGQQTVGAQLGHQPTPGSVAHAEKKADAKVAGVLERARARDKANDPAGCMAAVKEAKDLFGL